MLTWAAEGTIGMQLEPGSQLDRYTIEAIIGEGGMGRVCRAFDTRLRRRVALKVLHIADAADAAEAVTNALREARAAAAIAHPNATAVYDADEIDGVPYIVMEYVPGTSLRDIIAGREVPLAQRLRWLVDVAGALGAAHQVGIVHRDVKPENVMVRDDGLVKVLDFGVARRTVRNTTHDSIDTTTPGKSGGRLVGTPAYMPPEQIRGEPIDGRADQFAWGVLAYELLTGRLPWKTAREFLGYIAAVLTEKPDPPRTHVPEIPAQVDAAVMRALAKNPANRFPNMALAAAELMPFTGDAQSALIAASVAMGPQAERQAMLPPAAPAQPAPRTDSPSAGLPAVDDAPSPRRNGHGEREPTPVARPSALVADTPARRHAQPLPNRSVTPQPRAATPTTVHEASTVRSAIGSSTPPLPHDAGAASSVPPARGSAPVAMMSSGRRALPDGYHKLHEPRFELPVDVEAHAALLPSDATCKGLFFADFLRVGASAATSGDLLRAAQIPERRHTAFRDYPAAELLRLAHAVARAVHPRMPVGEGLRRLGQGTFDSVIGTHMGRSTLGILGADIEKILVTSPKMFRHLMSFGRVTCEKAGSHTYLYRASEFPAFLETFCVGVIEGALRHCRAPGKIRVALDDLATGLAEVRLG